MANLSGNDVFVSRDSSEFWVQVNYYIPGYSDPETGEYFGDTSWTVSAGGFGTGGWAGESDSPIIYLGFGDTLSEYSFSFFAQNTFSGDSYSFEMTIREAGLATTAQSVTGNDGIDLIVTGSGNDIVAGFGGNDYFDLGAGNDTADGGDGADYLDGGAGDDMLAGAAGDDTYMVDSAGDAIVEDADSGYDTVFATVSTTLAANVERLILLGNRRLDGTGNAGDDRIDGNFAINTLRGLDGDDALYGQGGRDLLEGGAGNDILDGGTEADRMIGGDGDDFYVVDNRNDAVIEAANGGIDTVRVATLVRYTLGDDLENLWIERAGGARGTGNALDNMLLGYSGGDTLDGAAGNDVADGGAGNDLLLGSAGSDQLRGGLGIDRVSYAASAAAVRIDLAAGLGHGGDAEGDTYTGVENVTGTGFADLLYGDAAANALAGGGGNDVISGGDGNDVAIGGGGADRLVGGAGAHDTLSYAGSAGAVIVDLAAQTAAGGDATGDVFRGFEDVDGGLGNDTITGTARANRLYGSAGDDTVSGGDGNDTVEGGTGVDVLDGGGGIDTLAFTHAAGGAVVNLSNGFANGSAFGDTFVNFENLLGSAWTDTFTGSDGGQRISGAGGNDILDGGAGNDVVVGGSGVDTMDGGAGIDTLSYATAAGSVSVGLDGWAYGSDASGDAFSNFENLTGSGNADALYGNGGKNVLRGGDGNDFLYGGGGNDVLVGGGGNDSFWMGYDAGKDRILDFQGGAGAGDVLYFDTDGGITTFEVAMASASMVGGNTVFRLDTGTTMTLVGVDMATLVADDFSFAVP